MPRYIKYASVLTGPINNGPAGGDFAGTYPNPTLATIQNPGIVTGHIFGFPMSYVSSTSFAIGFPNRTAPTSVCRNKADTAFMTVPGGTQYTVSLSTHGAILGDDSFSPAGTVTTGGTMIVNGSGTAFTTAFGTRQLTGTISTAGAVNGTITGTGTKFLSEIAVGDLIGTASSGYYMVISISSDTSLVVGPTATFTGTSSGINTITSVSSTTNLVPGQQLTDTNAKIPAGAYIVSISGTTLTMSATIATGVGTITAGGKFSASTTANAIESPTILVAGNTVTMVSGIQSDTALLTLGTQTSRSGVAWTIGELAPTTTFSASVSVSEYGNAWLVSGTTGTSVVVSTQRNTPYSTAFGASTGIAGYLTNYRRIGTTLLDSSTNIRPFTQDGLSNRRTVLYQTALGTWRPISNYTTASYTDFAFGVALPPSAIAAWVNAQQGGTATAAIQCSFKPRGAAPAGSTCIAITSQGNSNFVFQVMRIPCDGAQYISAIQSATTSQQYTDILGYDEDL